MDFDIIFLGLQIFAVFGWIALALAPLKRDYCITFARALAVVLTVAYLAQLFFTVEKVEGGGFTSLDGLTVMASSAKNILLGWTHYLAFDLLIGSWVAEDGHKRDIPHWLLLPCLASTWLFGPAGFLLYVAVRIVWAQAKGLPAPIIP
jgi:Domain of unknown function (DUF4281)